MTSGAGRRSITTSSLTVGQQTAFSSGSSTELAELQLREFCASPPERQRPVLLLADSMGQCIPGTDSVIRSVAHHGWTYDKAQTDIAHGRVDINHKNIIVWMGAETVKQQAEAKVLSAIANLLDTIKLRNELAAVYISSILPQPKHQRQLHDFIVAYNRAVKSAVLQLQQQDRDIHYLPTHSVYLDANRDIIRPIVDNFEDGLHLNIHGAHRLRQFWLQKLGLSK